MNSKVSDNLLLYDNLGCVNMHHIDGWHQMWCHSIQGCNMKRTAGKFWLIKLNFCVELLPGYHLYPFALKDSTNYIVKSKNICFLPLYSKLKLQLWTCTTATILKRAMYNFSLILFVHTFQGVYEISSPINMKYENSIKRTLYFLIDLVCRVYRWRWWLEDWLVFATMFLHK